ARPCAGSRPGRAATGRCRTPGPGPRSRRRPGRTEPCASRERASSFPSDRPGSGLYVTLAVAQRARRRDHVLEVVPLVELREQALEHFDDPALQLVRGAQPPVELRAVAARAGELLAAPRRELLGDLARRHGHPQDAAEEL